MTKTAMCRIFIQTGTCEDPNCGYAHELSEVRATNSFFKTSMCRFLRRGTCKLGHQCRYAHTTDELRVDTQAGQSHSSSGLPGSSSSSSGIAPPPHDVPCAEPYIGLSRSQQPLWGGQQHFGRHLAVPGQPVHLGKGNALTPCGLAQWGTSPCAGTGPAHACTSASDLGIAVSGPAVPRMTPTRDQPPSWEPTIPPAALVAGPSERVQMQGHSSARPANPAELLLREIEARMLSAAAPECYDD